MRPYVGRSVGGRRKVEVLGHRQVEDVRVRLVGDAEAEPPALGGRDAPALACSPISTAPSSGWTKPLAIPSNVDFPDPFSPTSAWISPARQSTLTSRSACTAPNAFDTPRSVRTHEGGSRARDSTSLFWLRFRFHAS